jgi:hypothetical protein
MERIGPLSRNFVLNQDLQDFEDYRGRLRFKHIVYS